MIAHPILAINSYRFVIHVGGTAILYVWDPSLVDSWSGVGSCWYAERVWLT